MIEGRNLAMGNGARAVENPAGPPANSGAIRLECRAEAMEIAAVLDNVEGVERFLIRPGEGGISQIEICPKASCELREALFRAFAEAKLPPPEPQQPERAGAGSSAS